MAAPATLTAIPSIEAREETARRVMPRWKRTMDVAISGLGLVVLTPVIAALAIAVAVDSPGGPFYRQTRVGKGGRPFTCWKFRSMHRGADRRLLQLQPANEAKGLIFKMRDDPRRTRVGRFLRRTSLDELPQLLNVLRGEMSIVGPRPPLAHEVLRYDELAWRRLDAVPGITGLWQVTDRANHDFANMVDLDIRYAESLSLKLDLVILAKTVPTVLGGRGSY
jgi:lipopolysaccharide/colanic/teichoic acid biosynthesis glycosyltransferase